MFTGPHEWNLDRSEDGGWRRREDNTTNVTEELVLQTIIWFHNRIYFTITEKEVATFNQEKALVGPFSVITNLCVDFRLQL